MAEPVRLVTPTDNWNTEAQRYAVELLEEWLARAKAGEIVAVAIAAETPDGLSLTNFTRPRHRTTMIGALAHLQYKIHCDLERN